MSWIFAIIGFFTLADAFDHDQFGVRQQWEVGLGVLLLILATVMWIFDPEDR